MTDASRYVTDEAVQAACEEADWTWGEEPHVPKPQYVMRPILAAAAPHIRQAVLREAEDRELDRFARALKPLEALKWDLWEDGHTAIISDQLRDAIEAVADQWVELGDADEAVSLYDPPQSETGGPEQAGKNEGDRAGLVGRAIPLSPSSPAFPAQDDTYRPCAALEAAVERVRALHTQRDDGLLAPGKWCPVCGEEVPCRTIRVLNGQS